ncbi:hypothetical protein GJD72_21820 [Klebsiella pneumoniae]|uniref:Phage head morphogenesis domain-containing protein n=1 Tax=Klebsiella phage vB_Kpn_Chronis TaxID=2591378 RepID=A0A5B9MSL2_9CAUD|nr:MULTISPECIES: hypothetical protein [Enterobacteriaceae]QEG04401.1 hypothetical protein CHRON_3 [Klebsiella phage vB_Kpn_Chronis]DAV81332.1 MAG TPA: hypothetical protein [Caudoviricetes sp.]ARN25488.1 hypothetical protein A4U70_07430 [Klebsiella pneumoniae]EFB2462411.1 hypothetical protein [Escherichia coli]EIT0968336.1 hypothetical protein [Escherichia coli]
MKTFTRTVREAVKFFLRNGYTSRQELEQWQAIIRQAAESETDDDYMSMVSDRLRKTYDLQVSKAGALERHKGLSRFTLNYMEPKLRSELDRRILASADLIKLNRTAAINKTVQRFSGWATSIPVQDYVGGGLSASSRSGIVANAQHIQKSAEQVDYEARRVMIDQSHKLIANIDNIIATGNNAIAAEWHSHWRQPGYDYREDHKERDKLIYLIRGNWAQKNGYVKAGPAGYLDEITQPGEEVFCRCYVTYLYNLRSIPEDMLTQKGRKFLESMKAA